MKNIRTAVAAVFFMMVLFIPSMTVSAAGVGETVSQNTAEGLRAVDYENNAVIAQLLAQSWTLSDRLNKKNEIAYREGKSPADISDEQAVQELNQDNLKVMSFEEAFTEVQSEIGGIIQRVVDSTEGAESKGAAFFTNKINQNKEKLLVGLTYLERLYDFDMGEHNVKETLLYESKPYMYGKIENVLDWLIYIGGLGGGQLKVSNNANVFGYGKMFWPVTAASSLEAFLEENRQKWIPDTSLNDWFLQESPAYILEKSSASGGGTTGLYKRLYDNAVSRAYILPLLTVSEDSVYVIANSATITYGIVDCYIDRNLRETDPARYAELREEFKQQLERGAKQQQAFIDCWYRIAAPEKKGLLSSNRVVLDSLRIDPNTTVQWSDKFGKNAALGVKEFFTPLNLYGRYMFIDGVAEGESIRYYVSKALTERGFSTYAHELTHMLVSEVMLNGYGSRDGMLAEVYTRGMFEPYELNDPPVFNLNLIYDRLEAADRYHNGVPERFQDETDLQSYMSGILDVIYTLDYAEADVMFTKSAEEKKKWFHKLEQVEDPDKRVNQGEEGSRHNLDSVKELTLDEAEKLNTIDDLIQDNIIVSRYEVNGTKTTGTMDRNGYYVVPLFSANYAAVQNDLGVSGDVMIRRQAFELLAEYGYYGGMVPYISNQYKESAKSEQTILSDQYILKKIFSGTYETMADFKKAMFQRRIEKLNELKPVTIMWKDQSVKINNFEKQSLLMKEAVESDLVKVNVQPGGYNNIRAQATEVERLKQEIFKAYLIQTEDFSESIYGAVTEPTDPPEGPGTEEPEKPGETEEPEKPGETEEPEKPGETEEPEKPGETEEPEKPGETEEPEKPGETEEPEKPGEPEEPGHIHVYEAAVTKELACTEEGVKTYTCSCGDTYTEKIDALNHKYVRKCIPATTKKKGKVQQVCSTCSAVRNIVTIASPKKISLSRTKYSYNGKVKTPAVTVTDANGKKLKAGTAYQVSKPKGRKNPGVYTVTVKFRGNYSGTVTRTFTIRPKKTSLGKITAGSRGMRAAWKKQTIQTDGYQIQYSTNGSFKGKTTKSVTAKRNTSVKKISKLKGNKKYYVRIRTYKTVKVGGKNKKLYSDWSKKKTIRTKG